MSLCIAIGLVLPQAFHMLPIANSGSVLLPMHIPVIICGVLCGYKYGAFTGFLLPFLSSILTGMPPLFPIGLSMMFELATYGFLAGLGYEITKRRIIPTLLIAMFGGRIVLGIANTIFFGMADMPYSFNLFITAAFITAIPGIILQFIIIPSILYALEKVSLTLPTVSKIE